MKNAISKHVSEMIVVRNGFCDGKERKMLFRDLPYFSSLVNGAISHWGNTDTRYKYSLQFVDEGTYFQT